MLSIIGAILGFGGSIFPQLLKFWQDKRDKAHELEVMKLQIEAQKQGHIQKLEEINAYADIEESKALYQHAEQKITGVLWVDALISFMTSSVRPVITYSFFFLYGWVKFAMYDVEKNILNVWNDYDVALFSTIIAFWFGSRTMQKFAGKR